MSESLTKKTPTLFSRAAGIFISRFSFTGKSDHLVKPALLVKDLPGDLTEDKKRYQKSGLTHRELENYAVTLVSYIEKTKIFLDPELTLEDLSFKTRIPKHHITEVLNDRIRQNFYSFINEYRIRQAVIMLQDKNQNSLQSIAFDCGFNSKSSFNNYFRNIMQETPSAYRNRIRKAKE